MNTPARPPLTALKLALFAGLSTPVAAAAYIYYGILRFLPDIFFPPPAVRYGAAQNLVGFLIAIGAFVPWLFTLLIAVGAYDFARGRTYGRHLVRVGFITTVLLFGGCGLIVLLWWFSRWGGERNPFALSYVFLVYSPVALALLTLLAAGRLPHGAKLFD